MGSISKVPRIIRKTQGSDERVGYGKPPKAHRFKPGQSGNPKGRKKGVRNQKTILKGIMQHTVPIPMRGKIRKISLREAIYLRIADDSLKGNLKSAAFLLNLDRMMQMGNDDIQEGLGSDDKAVLDAYLAEFRSKLSGDKS